MTKAPATPTEKLLLTTETPAGIRDRVMILLFCGGMAAAFALLACPPWVGSVDPRAVLAVLCVQTLLVGSSLLITVPGPRGTWELDDDGIVFQPCHRPTRSLRWSAVELMDWRRSFTTLADRKSVIVIPWNILRKEDRLRGRAFVAMKLGSWFDLKDIAIQTAREANGATNEVWTAKRLAMLVATVASITVLPLTALAWIPPAAGADAPIFYLAVPCVCAIAVSLLFLRREMRAYRSVHPTWPWRLRRGETTKASKRATSHADWLAEV